MDDASGAPGRGAQDQPRTDLTDEHRTMFFPVPATALVGREVERTALGALLPEARAVTLIGPGGSGKTRLAVEVASDALQWFRDGAWWVDLAGVSDPSMVPAAIAAGGGIHERPTVDLVDTLADRLRERHLLIVVDNGEHLADACATVVARLVHTCPRVTVLATSREALGIDGETVFPVPPLAVPEPAARSTAEIASTDAVRLFELRAQQVRPAFHLDDGNAAAVAEICRRLDGLPLAVELAAARVRVLSPSQIAAGLSDRFRLLTGGARHAPPRQRTLEASVAWSYGLLDHPLKLALARLSVFAGSFGIDGAEAVVAGPEVEQPVLDLIAGLADRSLLQVSERDGQARYRLLETIRVFARQRLAELDEPARVRDRHLEFHVDLAQRARVGLISPEPGPWLDRLTADLDDLRAAMDWALESQRPLAVLDIAEPTFAFWMVRGLYVEMRRRLHAAVRSRAAGDPERVRGLTTASILTLMGGDYPAGYAFAAEAVPLARAVGNEATLARALIFRSWCGFYAGAAGRDQIGADSDEALTLAERLGDHETHARGLMYAGALAAGGSSIPEGQAILHRAAAEIEDAGLSYMLPPTLAFLGLMGALGGRDLDGARAHARRAVDLGRRIGLHAFVSLALVGLGMADTLQGRERTARDQLTEAHEVARRSALPTFEMVALRCLAMASYRFGDRAEARRAAEAALEAAHDAGSRWDEAALGWLSGILALVEGRRDDARAHLERTRDLSQDPPYSYSLGRALIGLAQLEQHHGRLEEAWELAHDAVEVLSDYGDDAGVADALENLAGVASSLGRPKHALRLLAAASRFRDETGIGRFPLERERFPTSLAAARAALEAQAASTAWAEGASTTLAAAVAYARRGRGERGRAVFGWDALTPAEREVVRLVAEGCTNAEIGERLFVSVNTVKTHLAHVYTKLPVVGRAELAAEAARRGR
jgi:predicted ATPase/DNA-binding CsgD family transcriptional regulator